MTMITEKIDTLNFVEYDINVVADEDTSTIDLVFYPLMYPGDAGYDGEALFGKGHEFGFPVADYTRWYKLELPKNARGPRYRDALRYLEELVTGESFGDVWDVEGMDWVSCETVLTDPPALIAEFISKLPRRGQLEVNN